MKIVGYMDGTNSEVMTSLFLEGFETLPLSNGWDGHGKYIAHISRNDNISLVLGYLHKFIPIAKQFDIGDMFSSIKVYKIPCVFIVPKDRQAKAKKYIPKGLKYVFADPHEVTKTVMGILRPSRKKTKAKPKTKKKAARKKHK
jgi:hypothetical protein